MRFASSLALLAFAPACLAQAPAPAEKSAVSEPAAGGRVERPNIVLILADDLGYDDIGCFWTPNDKPGFEKIETPRLDSLAADGIRFTDFYVTAGVCTPTRSSLMTGCYPVRIGMSSFGPEHESVLLAKHETGLNPKEITVAKILKDRGYATAIVGKWHLGHREPFYPRRYGFDSFFGALFPNDYKENFLIWKNEAVVEKHPVNQETLTGRYTDEAVRFLKENRDRPFFLYMSHMVPHIPLFSPEGFKGKSARGVYGDEVMGIDWSTGRILDALRELKLEEKTLVIFTSDNGPDTRGPYEKRGQAYPLRGTKGTTREGGMREPCLMRWPGRIPKGSTCREVATVMDFLPTLAGLAGGDVPKDRIIDGKDILPLMTGQAGAKSPYEAFIYYHKEKLEAVRSGPWKLAFPRTDLDDQPYVARARANEKAKKKNKEKEKPPEKAPAPEAVTIPEALYNLEEDISESKNVIDQHPDVAERLRGYAEKMREDVGDSGRGMEGKNRRPCGRAADGGSAKSEAPNPK